MLKARFLIALILASFTGIDSGYAQVPVWHQDIVKENLYVRGEPVVVGQITVILPERGHILVHFDGQCEASYGDLIVLAASDTTDWEVNDGNVDVEAANADVHRGNFSHTRMYAVEAESNTFYAIAHNFVETGGNGIISLYGTLTVKYFPESAETFVTSKSINETNINVRGDAVALAEDVLQIPSSGNVLVRFDGLAYADVGDRIVLAASNFIGWNTNSRSTSFEAVNDDINSVSFSHSQLCPADPGERSYYAIAQNWVEMDGDGEASVYANLCMEYFPDDNARAKVAQKAIDTTDIYLRDGSAVLAEMDLETTHPGKVIAHFDGLCYCFVGDRIILAVSDTQDLYINNNNVSVEAVNEDQNLHPFSHTRVYEIEAGNHMFYALAENAVEQAGSGYASVFGNLTVEFFADINTVGIEEKNEFPNDFYLEQNYPNPFNPQTTIPFNLPENAHVELNIYNTLGEKITRLVDQELAAGKYRYIWQAQGLASGIYFYIIEAGEFRAVRKMMLLR